MPIQVFISLGSQEGKVLRQPRKQCTTKETQHYNSCSQMSPHRKHIRINLNSLIDHTAPKPKLAIKISKILQYSTL